MQPKKLQIFFIILILIINVKNELLCYNNNTNDVFVASAGKSDADYTILYDNFISTGAQNFGETVTVGLLGDYGQSQMILGALPLAIDTINKDQSK